MTAVAVREDAAATLPHSVPIGPREPTAPGNRSWLAAYALIAALAVLALALASNAARTGGASGPRTVFWLALAVLFVPVASRLLAASPSRGERLGLLVTLVGALYLMKVAQSPLWLSYHDELGQLRTTNDIIGTGKVLGDNPLVSAYSYYPGLELVTAALAQMSGLGAFTAGLLVVGAARLVMVVALFLVFERVTESSWVAGLAVLLYTANPNFIFFDGQYAYESFALPLGALAVALALRRRHEGSRGNTVACALVIVAVALSHHMTSYALLALFVAWAALDAIFRRRGVRAAGRPVTALALVAVVAVAGWAVVALPATVNELGSSLTGSLRGLFDIVTGQSAPKQAFGSTAGADDTQLARLTGFASVALVLAALPFGAWRAWTARRRHPLVLPLLLAAVAYVPALALRLTAEGTETSNRASEFVFVGIGLVVALALRAERRRLTAPRWRSAAVAGATVLFLGGLIVGWAPYNRLPGPYAPAATALAIEPQGIADARWAKTHLGPDKRVATDRINTQLMVAYGEQDVQRGSDRRLPLSSVFLGPTFGTRARQALQLQAIDFLVVDRRLSDALPLDGRYFEPTEDKALYGRRPIPLSRLTKFDAVPQLDRVFSSGAIVIYDARRLTGRR